MASFSFLRSQAREISENSGDPDVVKLADIIVKLCGTCEDVETKAKSAEKMAKDAERDAKRALKELKQ